MALPSFTFTIPRFKLPAFVSAVGNKLPQWPHALVLVTGLNAVLKMKLLPQDSLDAYTSHNTHRLDVQGVVDKLMELDYIKEELAKE